MSSAGGSVDGTASRETTEEGGLLAMTATYRVYTKGRNKMMYVVLVLSIGQDMKVHADIEHGKTLSQNTHEMFKNTERNKVLQFQT